MTKKQILSRFKVGTISHGILEYLWDSKNWVRANDLIGTNPNPLIPLIANKPDILEKEKVKLNENIKQINLKFRKAGIEFMIYKKQKTGFYKLKRKPGAVDN